MKSKIKKTKTNKFKLIWYGKFSAKDSEDILHHKIGKIKPRNYSFTVFKQNENNRFS